MIMRFGAVFPLNVTGLRIEYGEPRPDTNAISPSRKGLI